MEPLVQLWVYENAPEKFKIASQKIANPQWLVALDRDTNIEIWDWIERSIPKLKDSWFISNHFVMVW